MAVWTGRGLIVPLTVIAALSVAFFALAVTGQGTRYAWAGILAAGAVAGPAIFIAARRFDRADGGAGSGTFFFVPTRLWAFIVPAMMLLMVLGSLPQGFR